MTVGNNTAGAGHRHDGPPADPVERYLAEVDAALTAQGVEDRLEIVAGLREHILDATQGSDPGDTTALGTVLRQLGDPQLIASEAASENAARSTAPVTPPGRWRSPWVPVVALGLVLVGSALFAFVLPLALVVAGLVLVWGTSLWTASEKALATVSAIVPGLAVWASYSLVAGVQQCTTETVGQDVQTVCTSDGGSGGGVVATILLAAVFLAGLASAAVLARRARSRATR